MPKVIAVIEWGSIPSWVQKVNPSEDDTGVTLTITIHPNKLDILDDARELLRFESILMNSMSPDMPTPTFRYCQGKTGTG